MVLEEDLEKVRGNIDVESMKTDHKTDAVNSISNANEETQGTGGSAARLDLGGFRSFSGETERDRPEVVKEIDKNVNSGVETVLGACDTLPGNSGLINVAPLLRLLYLRNLDTCRAMLIKDCIRTKDGGSKDGQEVVQANLHKYVIRDYQSSEAFQKVDRQSWVGRTSPETSVRMAKLEWYKEVRNQIPASVIEKARKDNYLYALHLQDPDPDLGLDTLDLPKMMEDANNQFLQRRKISLFGGFVLLVPMPIMTLHPTLLTALLITPVFVFVVAIIFAIQMKTADPKDVLGATASYTAVLVVFVGTTTTAETPKSCVIAAIVSGVIISGTLVVLAGAIIFTSRQTGITGRSESLARIWGSVSMKDVLLRGLLG